MANRLASSKSPYLLQHKDNPVDWWQWGPDALAEAERLSKPILLSVGYAACHWCHMPFQRFRNWTSRTGWCIGTGQRTTGRAASCRMVHCCSRPSTLGDLSCLLELNAEGWSADKRHSLELRLTVATMNACSRRSGVTWRTGVKPVA
jgi:hypothetical protein